MLLAVTHHYSALLPSPLSSLFPLIYAIYIRYQYVCLSTYEARLYYAN